MSTLRGEQEWGIRVIWNKFNNRERIWPRFIRWHRRVHQVEAHPEQESHAWGLDPDRVGLEREIGASNLRRIERLHRQHKHSL